MPSSGSVTHWLEQLQAGDAVGAQKLWQRYFQRLVGLARKKLQGKKPRLADEEDVIIEGYTNKEIATKLSCFERTVFRRINEIRSLSKPEGEP